MATVNVSPYTPWRCIGRTEVTLHAFRTSAPFLFQRSAEITYLHSKRSLTPALQTLGLPDIWCCHRDRVQSSRIWRRVDRLESTSFFFEVTWCFPLLHPNCHRTADVFIVNGSVAIVRLKYGVKQVVTFGRRTGYMKSWVASFTCRPIYSRERDLVSVELEAGWTPEPFRTFGEGLK